MKPVSLFASLAISILCFAAAPSLPKAPAPEATVVFPSTTASVAAWNVTDAPDGRRANVALGITFLDAEVVLITEGPNEAKFGDLVQQVNDLGGDYEGHWLEQPRGDHIAILAKAGVTVTDMEFIPDSATSPNLRSAVAASVTIGQFDFLVVGMHLKASRSSSDRAIRTQQVTAVQEYIQANVLGTEKDVLVIGDYNMIPPFDGSDNDLANFTALNADGYLEFLSSDALAGQGSHISRSGAIGNLLDGYAISYDHTDEYIDGSIRIFPMDRALRMPLKEYARNVADHLPLIADFTVMEDDD